jgi:hypothetical protein
MANFKIKGVTLCFPNLFVAKLNVMKNQQPRPGQKARFDCMGMIPIDMNIKEIQEAAFQLLLDEKKFGDTAAIQASIKEKSIKWPFNTKATKLDGSARFDTTKYKLTITPWSYNKPGTVDRYRGPDGLPIVITEDKSDMLYSGCKVNLLVNPFYYENSGGRGVALGLQSVQFWEKGERLDNRVDAQQAFADDAEDRQEGDPRSDCEIGDTEGSIALTGAAGGRGAPLIDLFA